MSILSWMALAFLGDEDAAAPPKVNRRTDETDDEATITAEPSRFFSERSASSATWASWSPHHCRCPACADLPDRPLVPTRRQRLAAKQAARARRAGGAA
jgi:hypothetical protein